MNPIVSDNLIQIWDLPELVMDKICQHLVTYTPIQEIRPYGFHVRQILRLRITCKRMYEAVNNANILLWLSLNRRESPSNRFLTMMKERTNWEISQLFLTFNVNPAGVLGGISGIFSVFDTQGFLVHIVFANTVRLCYFCVLDYSFPIYQVKKNLKRAMVND